MKWNAKINLKNFNHLLHYLSETTASRIELIKIYPIYNEPLNEFLITVYCPQFKVDSEYIAKRYNVRVAKFSQVITETGIYLPGIDEYNETVECSHIKIQLVK